MKKPICKICDSEHKVYAVAQGISLTTLMAGAPPYWDEQGTYHPYVDPNHTTTEYHCSNGHTWRETT